MKNYLNLNDAITHKDGVFLDTGSGCEQPLKANAKNNNKNLLVSWKLFIKTF